ncbi:MAG: permease [Gracilibacter sp. BRH_c7a]|nr:MAG: permease [Gracilibacter sp. BRH_c7a]KUO65097.1 MAG: permease [Gracilibacter sp. BRH_c7a]
MLNAILYTLAITMLGLSYVKNKSKTKMALRKAWKSFENILPQFLSILIIIGISLSVLSTETISLLIGEKSGWIGIMTAAVIGSITLIPGFIAFPLTAALLKSGAGLTQIAVFISTLMMVGLVTLPLEVKYFGRKVALLRNSLAFAFSFLVAFVIGGVLR